MDMGQCPLVSSQSKPDLGTIFRAMGESFPDSARLNSDQRQVFHHIGDCRTAVLGGALLQCQDCGRWVGVYHSCRDRHCPKCQAMARKRWVEKRIAELLPVSYFHIVFTLPQELNSLILGNKRSILKLLFHCAAKTLLAFSADPKYMGGEPGIMIALHTWGQKLNFHPHVHCIITGGGISPDKTRWVSVPSSKYIFPHKALLKVFKGKFLRGLDRLRRQGLRYAEDMGIASDPDWIGFKRMLAKKNWVAYAKSPFGGEHQVLKYLGRYVNRAAIANSRILSHEDGIVRFRYKDYADNNRSKVLSLKAEEFARRFLLHVLPKGFMRIRFYGFMANCKKKDSLLLCRQLLGVASKAALPETESPLDSDGSVVVDNEEASLCPFCGKKTLIPMDSLTMEDRKLARSLLWDSS